MAKIAFLSFYSGVADRGVETFVFEVAKRLSKKHSVTIFQAGQLIKSPEVRTYQVKAFASAPKSSRGLLGKLYLDWQSIKILIFSLKSALKVLNGKYDLTIPLNGGWQTVIYRLITKLLRSKMLISGHAGIGADDAWNIFFRPDIFVALTKEEELWAKRLTPEVKTALIPNGVDLASFNPKVKPKKLNLKSPIVVCAAALVPYKRIDLTIKAVAKTQMSLLVLGDGEQKGYLDSLGKRFLKERYLRLSVPYANMPAYYRAGDIFSLASRAEAFGIAYVEAMACNLPVVTTSDKSRHEIIGDAGILTHPEDINQYATDLEIAAKTNYRNIPYNQALKFSWNKTAEKYLDLIKFILPQKGQINK
jgi:glycosyltransferase involved in cell wall biosynthesis